ncbi:hypothetical protein [Ferrimicrobium sp.]|uniref:hypothetical protein n=1 Tax=Ferrimicrobium sp. TaxID=2926050 RepID=UPI002615F9AF|nr:hypothetical protein [Ferrimicrobium sp.]
MTGSELDGVVEGVDTLDAEECTGVGTGTGVVVGLVTGGVDTVIACVTWLAGP